MTSEYEAEPQDEEPQSEVWNRFDITTGHPGPKPVWTDWSTNDDDDDGWPDDEVTRDVFKYATLELALKSAGHTTHRGWGGGLVTVTVDGREV